MTNNDLSVNEFADYMFREVSSFVTYWQNGLERGDGVAKHMSYSDWQDLFYNYACRGMTKIEQMCGCCNIGKETSQDEVTSDVDSASIFSLFFGKDCMASVIPKDLMPKKVAPKKAAPKKAAPKKAVPKKAVPKKAVPKKAAPKK